MRQSSVISSRQLTRSGSIRIIWLILRNLIKNNRNRNQSWCHEICFFFRQDGYHTGDMIAFCSLSLSRLILGIFVWLKSAGVFWADVQKNHLKTPGMEGKGGAYICWLWLHFLTPFPTNVRREPVCETTGLFFDWANKWERKLHPTIYCLCRHPNITKVEFVWQTRLVKV